MSCFLNIREMKPFRALPEGALRARVRMRLDDFAKVYIRFADGVRCYAINDDGEFFNVGPELCQGVNQTVHPTGSGEGSNPVESE